MADVIGALSGVLLGLSVAVTVRVVAAKSHEMAYPVLLVVIGVVGSALGLDPGFRLSSEVILVLLVPTVLFQGHSERRRTRFSGCSPSRW